MRAFILLILMASSLSAQDRAGNDTPGEWVITEQKSYGLWESFCDRRITGDVTEERCYLRYVDVFSDRPNFAAQFMFVTPDEVEFGIERGTRFSENGFRITNGAEVLWNNSRLSCLRGRECTYRGVDAVDLLETMERGETFEFEFTDRNGNEQLLNWDLTVFGDAMKNYRANALSKGLL